MDLGRDLRKFRKQNNWTQKQISEKLGVPSTTWASWENGQSQPKLEILSVLRQMGLEITGLTTTPSPVAPPSVIEYRLEELSAQSMQSESSSMTKPHEPNQNDTPESATSEAKRKANTRAAITMLENAAKSIQAAVMLLKEGIGE